jgi:hypothetical protein
MFRDHFKKRSYINLIETVPGNKNYKGNKFISVVYSKGVTIHEKREQLYKVVKIFEVTPKKLVKVKWDF